MATVLSPTELADVLAGMPDWSGDTDGIERAVKAPTFLDGLRLVDAVAEAAEAADHHPDIDIRWRTVTFRLATHSAGLPRESDFPYWSDPTNPFPTREALRAKIAGQTMLYPAERYFQYSNLGLTLVGSDRRFTESALDEVLKFIRGHVQVSNEEKELQSFGDELAGPDFKHWEE